MNDKIESSGSVAYVGRSYGYAGVEVHQLADISFSRIAVPGTEKSRLKPDGEKSLLEALGGVLVSEEVEGA